VERRRKKKEEGHVSHDRWLVSYADFITLLFAFFTTLYAISTVDAQKMGKMVVSMRASFDSTLLNPGSSKLSIGHGQGGTGSSNDLIQKSNPLDGIPITDFSIQKLNPMASSRKREVINGEKAMGRLKRSIDSLVGAEALRGKVRTYLDARGLIISLGEKGVFDSGSDQMHPEGKELLDTIATGLVSIGNYIRIEGHTDNVPISNPRFPSNWELSTARATAIISYMIAKFGLSPELLSAAGYAEYRPTASNDTEEGKALNRRVDIVVLNPLAARIEPR
jgi:chemotaxis protein MotB